MAIASIDPRTGETRAKYQPLDLATLERKLDLAANAFQSLRRSSFSARKLVLLRAAELLESEKESLGRMMTEEMGKTLVSAEAEVEKCARACRHYAEYGEQADGEDGAQHGVFSGQGCPQVRPARRECFMECPAGRARRSTCFTPLGRLRFATDRRGAPVDFAPIAPVGGAADPTHRRA